VLGTRPEAIKLAPVIAALQGAGISTTTLSTGQHPPEMLESGLEPFKVHVDEMNSLPDGNAERVGAILTGAYRRLDEHDMDAVLVQGDTYTAALWPLAARSAGVPVIHLEAGLRSFNTTSAEELHRRVAAQAAALHLAPTELSAEFLQAEGVSPEHIKVVGNSGIDALVKLGVARQAPELRAGTLMTAHRASNVDDPERLATLVEVACALGRRGQVIWPVHPRTRKRLIEHDLFEKLESAPGVTLTGPTDYRETIELLARASLVVTDSGGLQEEASYFGVPSVVMRETTPRWEGVYAGVSQLCGLDGGAGAVLSAADKMSSSDVQDQAWRLHCPYGDGHTGERVAALLGDERTWKLMEPYRGAGR
jgi:UDP-N-acetylglucosamine 2-epimerase (non-hydrolysing)